MSETSGEGPTGQPDNPDPYGTPPQSDPYGAPPPPAPYQQAPTNPYGAPQYNPTSVPGYGATPGYGPTPGYGVPGYPSASAKTDGMAIGSLVASVAGCLCGVGFLVGIVLGIIALRRTKGGQAGGRGLAVAGIVVGALGIVLTIALVVVVVVIGLNERVTPSNAEVGQCVNISEHSNSVAMVKKSCTEAHDAEIVGTATVTADNLTGAIAGNPCGAIISATDKIALSARSDLTLAWVTEHPDHLQVGDHVACYVQGTSKLYADVLG